MTELVFTAGERVTLDLRDSTGQITIKDWDGATIKVEAPATPYVLREQDTFRMRLPEGGTISLPLGREAEVIAPERVRLRVTRAGGETEVRAAPAGSSSAATSGPSGAPPRDFTEFADVMADYGKRIMGDIARSVRASGTGVSDDVARKLEEAAEKIEEKARQAAERLQREVERTVASAERHESHGRRTASHVGEQARRVAERVARHAERHAEREAHRAERVARHVERVVERAATRGTRRNRWWFAEESDQPGGARRPADEPKASQDERLAIMKMLSEGKINADQAARLLDALGG